MVNQVNGYPKVIASSNLVLNPNRERQSLNSRKRLHVLLEAGSYFGDHTANLHDRGSHLVEPTLRTGGSKFLPRNLVFPPWGLKFLSAGGFAAKVLFYVRVAD